MAKKRRRRKSSTLTTLPSFASKPHILAPAGNDESLLAAVAAGAEGVYCGLKAFTARMAARNFSIEELAPLSRLALEHGTGLHIALNGLLKPDDLDTACRMLDELNRWVRPRALIIQDLALIDLARQTGFSGQLHLSTLANVSFPGALNLVKQGLGVHQVVVPRELSVDELKAMASACPPGLFLEVFVHGALCYGVSGRCYWSSFLGGKSGLRGRCVQPCRRLYGQAGATERFFSCQDLSVDVLAKVLLSIPQVGTWKIEGRKKGPHYVYCTAKAYRILRDEPGDPEGKKEALRLLEYALGRKTTHYNFLPQRPQEPVRIDLPTGSGLLVGRTMGGKEKPHVLLRCEIFPDDILRVGYEDEIWHTTCRVGRFIPKGGRLDLSVPPKRAPRKGTPVFLVDRRDRELAALLKGLKGELSMLPATRVTPSKLKAASRPIRRRKQKVVELHVYRDVERHAGGGIVGLWISPERRLTIPGEVVSRIWWWLPPVVWPDEEDLLRPALAGILEQGGRSFVLNAPWQSALFRGGEGLNLWAGPFCNVTNPLALGLLADLGFSGAMISPELGAQDYLSLPGRSPLPLGIVIWAHWPLCLSRTMSKDLKLDAPFASPRGEEAWVRRNGSCYWVYPNWVMDLTANKEALRGAGYSVLACLHESVPQGVTLKKRPGLWNWDLGLA